MHRNSRFIEPCLAAALSLSAAPALALFEDFEHESLAAWRSASTGGSGTHGVELHNGSRRAYVKHVGSASNSLSIDVPYSPNAWLSFEMQAITVMDRLSRLHAGAGVTISFLNSFNVSLGSVAFDNSTDPAQPAAHVYRVDAQQHTYNSTMAEFAALAGLAPGAAIAKVSVTFGGWGGSFGSAHSLASLWFDNFAASTSPAAIDCLFDWAERTYATVAAPSARTQFVAPYSYRYYRASNSYLGVSASDNHVLYLDSTGTPRDLGELSTWLPVASCPPPLAAGRTPGNGGAP